MLEYFLKGLGPSALIGLMPLFTTKIGQSICDKDDNDTGTDDAFGKIVIAFGPAIIAFQDKRESVKRQSLEALHAALGSYLGKK